MKNFAIFFLMIITVVVCTGCLVKENESENYLRIHIRANSNLQTDQDIKYVIRDEIINYLTPIVVDAKNYNELIKLIEQNLIKIESLTNKILVNNMFDYKCKVLVNNEYFPTRNYGDYTLPANYYDALIVELGNAAGDNWWCVVYPPLCFVNSSKVNGSITYKSKIKEIINNFKG